MGAQTWELEIRRKAPLSCSVASSMLQYSFSFAAAQLKNDILTAERRMLQCNFCSATLRKLQRNFCFRLWHVAGVRFRGVGFRTCWFKAFSLIALIALVAFSHSTPGSAHQLAIKRIKSNPDHDTFEKHHNTLAMHIYNNDNNNSIHVQYDWTTGVRDNGNDWRKFCVVPRSHPLRSFVLYFV